MGNSMAASTAQLASRCVRRGPSAHAENSGRDVCLACQACLTLTSSARMRARHPIDREIRRHWNDGSKVLARHLAGPWEPSEVDRPTASCGSVEGALRASSNCWLAGSRRGRCGNLCGEAPVREALGPINVSLPASAILNHNEQTARLDFPTLARLDSTRHGMRYEGAVCNYVRVRVCVCV